MMKPYKTYLDSLLVSYLATNECAGVEVDGRHKVGEATQATAVTNGFSILAKDVAGTEV